MTTSYFVQGRVFACSADEAAMAIRDKHNEHDGDLTVFRVNGHCGGWWEYMLCIKTPEVTNEPVPTLRIRDKDEVIDACIRTAKVLRDVPEVDGGEVPGREETD